MTLGEHIMGMHIVGYRCPHLTYLGTPRTVLAFPIARDSAQIREYVVANGHPLSLIEKRRRSVFELKPPKQRRPIDTRKLFIQALPLEDLMKLVAPSGMTVSVVEGVERAEDGSVLLIHRKHVVRLARPSVDDLSMWLHDLLAIC